MSECCCSENDEVRLIYARSGAANTGFLADKVARNLAGVNGAKMTCLAAIGARLSGFLESAKSAIANIMIDGCPVSCGKKVFTESDKSRRVDVFEDHEKQSTCRYCEHYVVNPFTQRCGLRFREVEATDSCGDFVLREEEEEDEDTG